MKKSIRKDLEKLLEAEIVTAKNNGLHREQSDNIVSLTHLLAMLDKESSDS